jgi:hypothetical protein
VKDYMWLHSRGILRKVICALIMLKTVSMAAGSRAGLSGRSRPHPGSGRPGPGRSGSPPGPGPRRGPGPRPTPRVGPVSGARAGARHRVNPRQPRPTGARRSASPPAGSPTPPPLGPTPGRNPTAAPGPRPGLVPAPAGWRPLAAPAHEPSPSRHTGDAVPPVRASGTAAGRWGGGAPAADVGRPSLRPGSGEPVPSPAHPRADRDAAHRTTRPVPGSAGQPVRYSHTANTPPRPPLQRPRTGDPR